MDKQKLEISEMELTTEELNDASGGRTNAQTPEFRAFVAGIVEGYMGAGGHLSITFWHQT